MKSILTLILSLGLFTAASLRAEPDTYVSSTASTPGTSGNENSTPSLPEQGNMDMESSGNKKVTGAEPDCN